VDTPQHPCKRRGLRTIASCDCPSAVLPIWGWQGSTATRSSLRPG